MLKQLSVRAPPAGPVRGRARWSIGPLTVYSLPLMTTCKGTMGDEPKTRRERRFFERMPC
jgi:hypothetical protein